MPDLASSPVVGELMQVRVKSMSLFTNALNALYDKQPSVTCVWQLAKGLGFLDWELCSAKVPAMAFRDIVLRRHGHP